MTHSPINPTLTLTPEQMEAFGQEVFACITEHFNTQTDPAVTAPSSQAHLQATLREPIPQKGMAPSDVLNIVKEQVFSEMTHADHPRNFSFVPSPSNFISAMADALVSSYNVFAGAAIGPSAIAEIEITTINWLLEMFGFPVKQSGGIFVSGGSMANLTAMAVARQVKLKNNTTNATVYLSDQTHSSVEKDLRILGFQTYQIRKIPSGDDFRLSMNDLRTKLDEDRARGMQPFCVVANAGTTNAGAVDPLNEIAQFCKEEDLWMHIDAAYGGGAILCDEGKKALSGIELADSVTVDPHKWFFQPYEIGCILVRNHEHLKETFRMSAEYLDVVESDEHPVNFFDYGVQLTRGFRALKLWMSMKVFGVESFSAAVQTGYDHAVYMQQQLETDPRWEIVSPAQLGVLNFRVNVTGLSADALDAINKQVMHDITTDGFAMICPTTLSGKLVIRMCMINPRTTQADIDETLARLTAYADTALKIAA